MFVFFFFFKQKTAYEMRISDWSSDVCSSDLQTSRLRNAILLKKKFGLKGRTIGGQVRPAAEIVHDILPGRGQYGLRIPRPPLRTLDPRLQESGEQVAVERSEGLIMVARGKRRL